MDSSANTSDATPAREGDEVQAELDALEARVNAMLPPQYVGCFEDVPPSSMGSASLRFDKDGKVEWGSIWTTFCHLALAGGPPHRGKLLPAVSPSEATSQAEKQALVVAEIKRAIALSTELTTIDDAPPGWVGIRCQDTDMAAWLVRAIVAENVIARHEDEVLFVPAGPHFRLEKEIKNVVVCVAKSCHYLLDHVEPEQRPRGWGEALIQPALPEAIAADPANFVAQTEDLEDRLAGSVDLPTVPAAAPGWIGVQCFHEEMAVWMHRAIVASNILARRENDVLYVPVCIDGESSGKHETITQALCNTLRLWRLHSAVSGKTR